MTKEKLIHKVLQLNERSNNNTETLVTRND